MSELNITEKEFADMIFNEIIKERPYDKYQKARNIGAINVKDPRRQMYRLKKYLMDKLAEGIRTNIVPKLVQRMDTIIRHAMAGFERERDVTGNTINSFGVGLYCKGELIAARYSFEITNKMPLRKPLAKGEKMNITPYWDGRPPKGSPYVAETDGGDETGPERIVDIIESAHPMRGKNGFSFLVAVGVPYAKYHERRRGMNVLSDLRQYLNSAGALVRFVGV